MGVYNPPKKPAYKPPPPPTKPAYKPPAPKKQTYQQNKNAPVYVPAPKKVIQTKVAPSKTNTKSEKSSVVEKLPVAQARSAPIQTSSAVVGASVSVESSDTKKEVLTRRGTVEDIDPKE